MIPTPISAPLNSGALNATHIEILRRRSAACGREIGVGMRPKDERGQVGILSYVTVIVLAILGGTFLERGLTVQRHSEIQQLHAETFYLAEGALENAIGQFAQALANFQWDPQTNGAYPVTTNFSASSAFPTGAIVTSNVTPLAAQVIQTDADGNQTYVRNYEVVTTSTHPRNAAITATLHQVISRQLTYTFQHAVFYDGDLEWLPGPDMTLSGKVHSNSDIYLGANGLLTINNNYLRSAGNIYNRRKDDNSVPPGTVQIKKNGLNQYAAMAGLDSADATWAVDSQTRWLGTVRSSVHGVSQSAVPVVGSIQPGGFYDSNADVRVVNDVIIQGGLTIVEGVDVPVGTLTSTTSMRNNREGRFVKMLEIDLKKLSGYAPGDPPGSPSFPNHLPSNGLLYATRNDSLTGTQQRGVRLINGSEIRRNGGLTIVSNLPLYIKGNYNTTSKKPCAVIADAVNLLSNNWNDANSTSSVSSRPANATTFNLAFIAGINTTTSGHYNGGLENYPRLHESWTGQTLTIRGSFVSLWNSQIATGQWAYGNPQYTAPVRNWQYDSMFEDGTTMPPFTPWAVEIVKGAWWKD
ncbi:MAG: hypothetical protein HYU33_02160 [Candidatus Omnitrophica bacterium]|nr:hypothetical protein [Candidatus Omnitrophota bacterium]